MRIPNQPVPCQVPRLRSAWLKVTKSAEAPVDPAATGRHKVGMATETVILPYAGTGFLV